MKPLLIIGASAFGKLVEILAEDAGHEIAGFIDDVNSGDNIVGTTKDIGSLFLPDSFDLALAIGYKHLTRRLELFRELSCIGFNFPRLKHPGAHVSRKADVGPGAMVMSGANVDSFTRIGSLCVIWPAAIVSHDSTIGENTFISPGATLCGFVTVGTSTFVGANSVIVDGSSVPPSSFVKAGSLYNSRQLRT